MPIIIILIFIFLLVIVPGFRVIRQYERGVVFTLGKYSGIRNPGLRVVIPYLQTITRVDVRTTPIDVAKQEVITKDNVTVGVDAIVYFRGNRSRHRGGRLFRQRQQPSSRLPSVSRWSGTGS